MFSRFIFNNLKGIDSNNKEITLLKNSKNDVLHFSLKNNKINFFIHNLFIKKIPKNKIDVMSRKDVYLVIFKNGSSLLIQPITDLFFLKEKETGFIEKINIIDLNNGDQVFCYDNLTKDYYYEEIDSVNIIGDYNDTSISSIEDTIEDTELNYNDYLIGTTDYYNGIIINNYMLMG